MSAEGTPGVVPQGGVRKDPQLLALADVPGHLDVFPGGIRTARPGLQAPLALPVRGCAAARAWGLRCGRMREGRLPAPARHHGDAAVDTRQGQRHRGEAAIDDQVQPSSGPPLAHLRHHLPDPIITGHMPTLAPRVCWRALRGGTRQRPHPPTPGHGDQAINDTHFRPKQRITWDLEKRTASREHPLALIFRPLRRPTVSPVPARPWPPAGPRG
jgi:hypothetical protein